jgi:hypothetical protein
MVSGEVVPAVYSPSYRMETYQHVLPAFISAWVAVEMLGKTGLHVSPFVL